MDCHQAKKQYSSKSFNTGGSNIDNWPAFFVLWESSSTCRRNWYVYPLAGDMVNGRWIIVDGNRGSGNANCHLEQTGSSEPSSVPVIGRNLQIAVRVGSTGCNEGVQPSRENFLLILRILTPTGLFMERISTQE